LIKKSELTLQLSVMMFLEYAARGVWYPYLPNYLQASISRGGLGFSSAQVGWVFVLAAAIGAIVSPIVAGQLADRYLNAEKALALLLVPAGLLLMWQARVTDFRVFLALSLVQSLAYMPTLALTNGISFSHLKDPERLFPRIRMWGTIGWAAVSFAFPLIFLKTADPVTNIARIGWALVAGGVFCWMLGIYGVLFLPKTPPRKSSANPLAFVEAFGLLRQRTLLGLILLALPVSIIHQAFYIRVGPFVQQVFERGGIAMKWVGPALAVGQISEGGSLFLLGWLLKRLGYRAVFMIALAAFALRFGLFAIGNSPALAVAGASLHGICFAFFFAAAYVYVEKIAPPDARHSAQTVFNLITLGVGPILTGFYNARFDRFAHDYRPFWLTQAAIAAGCLLGMALFTRRAGR
jgi:nucleoside transporter